MKDIKLKELMGKVAALKEKKNAVGKVPALGLTIHVDNTYDPASKQLSVGVTVQSAKAAEYVIPNVEEADTQEKISGLQSELGAAIKGFSKAVSKILDKYQQ